MEGKYGVISPKDVIDVARDEDHPLHNRFEWDDTIAGKRYRLMQARVIINSVRVEFMGEKREAFLSVVTKVEKVERRGYVSLPKVVSNEEMHSQVLRDAVKELEHWEKKYNSLIELRGIFDLEKLRTVKKTLKNKEE